MILITGGTGFVGKAMISHLANSGYAVRVLLRPSPESPDLPLHTPVEVTISDFENDRSVQAAMNDIDVIYHFIGSERYASRGDLTETDIEITQALTRNAVQAGVKKIIYLSHLGANISSAYPLLKAKAIAENNIKESGLDYTIIRSAPVFGPGDHFSTSLERLIRISPFILILPGDGDSILQPIFINDLVAALSYILEAPALNDQTISIGGGIYYSFKQIIQLIMKKTNKKRRFISINPGYLRLISIIVENFYPQIPVSTFWLDYLASDRTAPLDTLPRVFGILPSSFEKNIDYLKRK